MVSQNGGVLRIRAYLIDCVFGVIWAMGGRRFLQRNCVPCAVVNYQARKGVGL